MYWYQIKELLPLQQKFKDLVTQLELKSHDLSLMENRAKQNEHHKVEPYLQEAFKWHINSAGFSIVNPGCLLSRIRDNFSHFLSQS